MSQSLSQVYIHFVFRIKHSSCTIKKENKNSLYAYMGSIIKESRSIPIIINGTEDHVHILFILSKTISIAKFAEDIKRHSSRWIKKIDPYYKKFAWQGGYGAFSVNRSSHNKIKKYIINQEEHHKKVSFKDEFLEFLEVCEIDYNEKYFLTD